MKILLDTLDYLWEVSCHLSRNYSNEKRLKQHRMFFDYLQNRKFDVGENLPKFFTDKVSQLEFLVGFESISAPKAIE